MTLFIEKVSGLVISPQFGFNVSIFESVVSFVPESFMNPFYFSNMIFNHKYHLSEKR